MNSNSVVLLCGLMFILGGLISIAVSIGDFAKMPIAVFLIAIIMSLIFLLIGIMLIRTVIKDFLNRKRNTELVGEDYGIYARSGKSSESNRSINLFAVLFTIVGIISCFVAVIMLVKSVPVKAVVTSLVDTEMTDMDNNNRKIAAYEVYASYIYNDEEYNDIYCGTFGGSRVNAGDRSVGSVFSLRIDPNDPSHAIDPKRIYLLMTIGAFFGAVGLIVIMHGKSAVKKNTTYPKKKDSLSLKICIIIILILYVLVALKLIFMIMEFITTGNFNDTNATTAFVIFFILLIFMLFIRGMIKTYKENKRINRLFDEGLHVYAQLDKFSAVFKEEKDYDNDYYRYYEVTFYFSYTAPSGRIHSFVSDPFHAKEHPQIVDNTVSIYIDKNNSENYYIDLEEFKIKNNIER